MTQYITTDIRSRADFKRLEKGTHAIPIVYNTQFERILLSGELIFFGCGDGYITMHASKRRFLRWKHKVTMYAQKYDGTSIVWSHDSIPSATAFFLRQRDLLRFFYIPTMEAVN